MLLGGQGWVAGRGGGVPLGWRAGGPAGWRAGGLAGGRCTSGLGWLADGLAGRDGSAGWQGAQESKFIRHTWLIFCHMTQYAYG